MKTPNEQAQNLIERFNFLDGWRKYSAARMCAVKIAEEFLNQKQLEPAQHWGEIYEEIKKIENDEENK